LGGAVCDAVRTQGCDTLGIYSVMDSMTVRSFIYYYFLLYTFHYGL